MALRIFEVEKSEPYIGLNAKPGSLRQVMLTPRLKRSPAPSLLEVILRFTPDCGTLSGRCQQAGTTSVAFRPACTLAPFGFAATHSTKDCFVAAQNRRSRRSLSLLLCRNDASRCCFGQHHRSLALAVLALITCTSRRAARHR